jgi:hypothetical protein
MEIGWVAIWMLVIVSVWLASIIFWNKIFGDKNEKL